MGGGVEDETRTEGGKENCCKSCSNVIVGALERSFASIGRGIARYPIPTIAVSLIVCLLFVIGLKERYDENRGERLWVSSDSDSLKHAAWFGIHYPPEVRVCSVIAETTNNVLTPEHLQNLCTIDETLKAIAVNNSEVQDVNWENTCFSPTNNGICAPTTILQIWKNNCTHVRSLNKAEILTAVNAFAKGNSRVLEKFLGGVKMTGQTITAAKSSKMVYFLKNQLVFVRKEGRKVDARGKAWEEAFEEFFTNNTFSGLSITYSTETSRRSDSSETISGDLQLLIVSIVLAIIYLVIMLGTLSRLNHKVWLAICGVICIALSMGFSYGFCSACQLFVTPVHNILPFLLLGIGIDDVFVIVQNWELYGGGREPNESVPDFIGKVMQHAGVSILVTSITDICAFLIGATTILPALRSFCIFSGMGIIAVFLLTCTFFMAWLALDTRRKKDRRDACCCCIKLKPDWQPMACSEKGFLQTFMTKYANVILSVPGKIFVLLMTAGLFAGGAYGLSQLRQDFDQDNFLPPDAMTLKYKVVDALYFKGDVRPGVYVGKVNYFDERSKLDELHDNLNSSKYVVPSSVDSWYRTFKTWMVINSIAAPNNEAEFYDKLGRFLNSTQGARYKADVKFNVYGEITASRMFFTHIKLDGSKEMVAAMDDVQEIAKNAKFPKFGVDNLDAFCYTRFYASWETNKIIAWELVRNLILAGAVILIITLILLADIAVCLLVLVCIVLSLVNVSGYMHFWNLTIDVVTTIQLIIAIGLTVDYSAHIAHAFMSSRLGSKVDRARDALVRIGPAVFHGGFSTFLAFVALAGSNSYVFLSFFKVLFLVVLFGLFHGLVLLPVILSLVGPQAYGNVVVDKKTSADNPPAVDDRELKRVGSFENEAVATDS